MSTGAMLARATTAVVVIVVLAVALGAVVGWRHHRWAHQMPAPLPSVIWDDHTLEARQQVKTWRWTLLIYPHGSTGTQALPYADGYVRATDADTATNLTHHDADTLMPAHGFQGQVQVSESTTPFTPARQHQSTELIGYPPDTCRTTQAPQPAAGVAAPPGPHAVGRYPVTATTAPLDTAPTSRPPAALPASPRSNYVNAATIPPDHATNRRPGRPRPAWTVLGALTAALLGAGPNLDRPILSADQAHPASSPTPAARPAAPTGPTCGPRAVPAGHQRPQRVGLALGLQGIRPAGWALWCTHTLHDGDVELVWLAIGLDRATALASDICQLHDCWITVQLQVPTRGPDTTTTYRQQIDHTNTPQITITTTAVALAPGDYANAQSPDATLYLGPHGYTQTP